MVYSLLLLLGCAVLGYAALGRRLWRVEGGLARAFCLATLAGILLFSWVGVLLAALGLFRPWIVALLVGLLMALAVYRIIHQRPKTPLPIILSTLRPNWTSLLGVGLFLVLAWLYAQPAETFLVIDDASIYTLGGIALARDGSLWHQSIPPWTVTADLMRGLFQINPSGMITRYVGSFYQHTFGGQELEIGFLPLPKVWTALCCWLFGAKRAMIGSSVFGLASILAFWHLLKRSLGPIGSGVATLALALCLPQIWYAHYPLSEIYAQALLFSGLLMLLIARQSEEEDQARLFIILSALSLGLLTLVRFEALLILAPLAFFAAWAWRTPTIQSKALRNYWLTTLGISCLVSLAIAVATSRFYLFDQTLGTAPPETVRMLLALALACVPLVLGCALLSRKRPELAAMYWGRVRTKARAIIAALWALALVIGLSYGLSQPWGETLPHWLIQYLTPSGLVLSLTGLGVCLVSRNREEDSVEITALLGTAALFAALYTLRPMVVPIHPWAMRRLVPLVLPALALGLGALAQALVQYSSDLTTGHRPRVIISRFLICAVISLQIYLIWHVAEPIADHREMAGLWDQLFELDKSLAPDAAVLFDSGEIGQALAPTMELAFDRPSFALRDTTNQEIIAQLVSTAYDTGLRTYLVSTTGSVIWNNADWLLLPAGGHWIEVPRLGRVDGRPPNDGDLFMARYALDIYEIVPAKTVDSVLAPGEVWTLPESSGTALYLRSGFYPPEFTDTGAFRWTAPEALLELPWPADQESADFCLRLSIAGGRPGDEAPAQVVIHAEGRLLDERTLPNDYAPTQIDIPVHSLRNTGDPDLEITLSVNGWSPVDYGSGDARDLGIALYRLSLAGDCETLPDD